MTKQQITAIAGLLLLAMLLTVLDRGVRRSQRCHCCGGQRSSLRPERVGDRNNR